MADKRVELLPQTDGTFLLHELSAEDVAALQAEQERQTEFERNHGLPEDAFLALIKRQSGLCGYCSKKLLVGTSFFEAGDSGSAVYCSDCSMTLAARRDKERFGGSSDG